MSLRIVNKNSTVQDKVPLAADLEIGEIAVNANVNSPAAYIKDSAGNVVKIAGSGSVGDDWTRTGTALSPKTAGDTIQFSTGTAALPGITPVGNADTGIYSPGANQVAISTSGTQRLTTDTAAVTSTLPVVHPLGTASTPSLTFTSDLNTGIYSPGADQLALSTNGTGRLFVDSSGRILINANIEGEPTADDLTIETAGQTGITIRSGSSSEGNIFFSDGTSGDAEYRGVIRYDHSYDGLTLYTAAQERLRITSAGLVGIGTSAPSNLLHVQDTSGSAQFRITGTGGYTELYSDGNFYIQPNGSTKMVVQSGGNVGIGTASPSEAFTLGSGNAQITGGQLAVGVLGTSGLQFINNGTFGTVDSNPLVFRTAATERARIDTSGRLLVGTSSARNNFYNSTTTTSPSLQIEGTTYSQSSLSLVNNNTSTVGGFPMLIMAKSAGSSVGSNTAVSDGHVLGQFTFQGNDGSEFVVGATISAVVDGTSGANDLPTRLEFSTTADGASSPTERMRIKSNGTVEVSSSIGAGENIARFTNSSSTGNGIFTSVNSDSTSYVFFQGFSASAVANRILIYTNGNVVNANNSYGAISDAKLKENVVDANSQWDDLKALRVRKYNLKEGQNHTQIGLIAQEVELVSPGLVSESPDRDEDGNDLGTVTKSVNYSVLYMKAVKALQEAMERIEQLESEMAAVKAQLS